MFKCIDVATRKRWPECMIAVFYLYKSRASAIHEPCFVHWLEQLYLLALIQNLTQQSTESATEHRLAVERSVTPASYARGNLNPDGVTEILSGLRHFFTYSLLCRGFASLHRLPVFLTPLRGFHGGNFVCVKPSHIPSTYTTSSHPIMSQKRDATRWLRPFGDCLADDRNDYFTKR